MHTIKIKELQNMKSLKIK